MVNGFHLKWFLVLAAALIAVSGISIGVISARRHQPGQQRQQKRVTELPPVISNVPKLIITSVQVKDAGTPNARAVIEIRNDSELAVMAVEISTKSDGDSGAVNEDGLDDADNPRVVIPPHGSTTLEMNFGEMIADAPLVVSAAVFSDGSEDGDQWSLNAMKAVRGRRQLLRKSSRGGGRP